MTSSIDPLTIVLMIMFLAVFFFAGYLIIYNIFYLNIISDTQEYGLLKTIGTTGKQIRQIVLRRASLLSLFGIPIGLILGIGVGAYLLPVITEDLNTVSFDKGKVHLNVWIILLTVVFSYVTVIISSLRPCKNAARVSPIEALKFTEKLGKNGKPKRKKASRESAPGVAWAAPSFSPSCSLPPTSSLVSSSKHFNKTHRSFCLLNDITNT